MDIKTLFWHSSLKQIDMSSKTVFSLIFVISDFTPRKVVKKMISGEFLLYVVSIFMLDLGHRGKKYS